MLVGLVLDRLGYLAPIKTVVQTVLVPFQRTVSSVAQDLSRRTTPLKDAVAMQARVTELETLSNRLMVENVQLREVIRENELLRQLLNYTQNNTQFSYQPTTIIGRSVGVDPTNLLYFVYVDVGASNGVARHMPVITERGLVGRVTAVGPNSAQVLLLIDPSSAVNALIQNGRATGIVRGNIDGTLTMDRIPQGETVRHGDIVLTSGLGGNFPSKLVIGQVTEVLQHDQDMFQTAKIRPSVDFYKLEILLIVTSFPPVDFEQEILESQKDIGN